MPLVKVINYSIERRATSIAPRAPFSKREGFGLRKSDQSFFLVKMEKEEVNSFTAEYDMEGVFDILVIFGKSVFLIDIQSKI